MIKKTIKFLNFNKLGFFAKECKSPSRKVNMANSVNSLKDVKGDNV